MLTNLGQRDEPCLALDDAVGYESDIGGQPSREEISQCWLRFLPFLLLQLVDDLLLVVDGRNCRFR